jgi:thioredoxin 1
MIEIVGVEAFEDFIKNNPECVVSFHGEYCSPCKFQEKELLKLKDIPVARIDVETNSELCDRYAIGSIPATFIFKDGNVCESITGYCGIEKLENKIKGV